MLEIFFIGVLIFLALTFFYKQSVHEFRINQIEWTQQEKMPDLFSEKVPIVLRGRPPTAFWTQEDVHLREIYAMVPIFEDRILSDWITHAEPDSLCPWNTEHARLLGARHISGLELWTERILNPVVYCNNPLLGWWLHPISACWAGGKGLWKTVAPWTSLFVSQGAIVVTIMTGAVESSLPVKWDGIFPSRLTAYDTPFISDLKYMDIVLRPGNLLFMPAHWFVSWNVLDEGDQTICPMICTVEYHSPISRFAEWTHNKGVRT
jgi:hypothetical protein